MIFSLTKKFPLKVLKGIIIWTNVFLHFELYFSLKNKISTDDGKVYPFLCPKYG